MNKRILFFSLFIFIGSLLLGQAKEASAACLSPYTDYDYPSAIGETWCCRNVGIAGYSPGETVNAYGDCCVLVSNGASVPPPSASGYDNPLKAEDIVQFIWKTIKYLFGIALVASVLLIIIGAYVMATSGGIPSRQDKGRKIIIWTLIGLTLMLLARGIIAFVFLIIGA